jgi:hypothetical protein
MDNNRNYTDVGLISKHSSLNIQDVTDGKFFLLVPTTTLPATKGAPATVDKTVLTDGSMTQVEGLQSNDQKTYTFNYHRDNIRQLKKYKGKKLTFIERNPDNTGERFIGTLAFGRTDVSVNGIVQGNIFITVESADDDPIDDVRDLIKPTAIITNALEDVNLTGTGSVVVPIETSEGATVAVASASTSIATATYADGKLTVTGVAAGSTFINLTVSKTGEATSYRSIAVNVISE